MATARSALELKLVATLRRIAAYDSPAKLRKSSERDWGLSSEEAMEMAYENIQAEAKNAIRGVRVAKSTGND
jgi:hypothetical protein